MNRNKKSRRQPRRFRPELELLEERWVPASLPSISALSLPTGALAGGTLITIIGANLTSATAVNFGAAAAHIASNTDTAIVVTAPAGAGTVDVTVTTSGG